MREYLGNGGRKEKEEYVLSLVQFSEVVFRGG